MNDETRIMIVESIKTTYRVGVEDSKSFFQITTVSTNFTTTSACWNNRIQALHNYLYRSRIHGIDFVNQ